MKARIEKSLRICLAGLALAGAAALPVAAATLAEEPAQVQALPLQLQTNVTVIDGFVRLRDLFIGDLAQPDRIVAEAPAPNQRVVLPAEWLASVAQANGLAWRPSSTFERATVFRAGQTIESAEIADAVRTALLGQGMPAHYRLKLSTVLPSVMIGAEMQKSVSVRDVRFDAKSGQFSAMVEVASGQPQPRLLSVAGGAFAMVMAPVLKQPVPRNTVLTADMITVSEVIESQLPNGTSLDAGELIGKAARIYLRAGQTVRATDVTTVSYVNVPVLKVAVRRGARITENMVDWREMNANDLPTDAILDDAEIVGHVAKRVLNFATPLHVTDVEDFNQVEIPVAARDVVRGTTLGEEDITWASMDAGSLGQDTVRVAERLIGFVANGNVRAGQPFRAVAVVRPTVVEKGKLVNLVYANGIMKLTAKAKALEDGAKGQIVRVVNTKSNSTVLAEVVDPDTVRIVAQQSAMN